MIEKLYAYNTLLLVGKVNLQASMQPRDGSQDHSRGGGRKKLASSADIRKMVRLVTKQPFLFAKGVKRMLGPERDKFSARRIR